MKLAGRWAGLLVVSVLWLAGPAVGDERLVTPFEQSGGQKTPRYPETISWFEKLDSSSSIIHFTSFGRSAQGRLLPLVVADLEGRFTPADHSDRGDRTVVLMEACIHAGESCGKDAGMILLRDLAEDPQLASELLANTTLVFIPIFNVDGHERFSPYGRINQNGPEEMGWRVTAQNQNLNRDFVKADLPEMRGWLDLFNHWDPDFFIDIHSTDGADYQYALTYGLEVRGNMEAGLTRWTRAYEDAMVKAMEGVGYPIAPYVSFKSWHDPRSGLVGRAMGPRFSQGYTAIRNRPGLLIETHMLKDYRTRVEATRLMVANTLMWLADQGSELRQAVRRADQWTASPDFRSSPYPLRFEVTDESHKVDFLGVSYEQVTSEISGGQWYRYHGDQPETMELEFFETLEPSVTAQLPEAYLVPPEWSVVIDRLAAHGIAFRELAEPVELEIRTWRLTEAAWRQNPYEGHHPVTFKAEPHFETRTFPAGTVLVDMNQPLAPVAAHLLEPEGPDSMLRWGYLDAIFERVEYVESYVIEEMMAQMVAEKPELLEELNRKKAVEPDFADDPWAIRYWFYAKTPYFDQRVGVYPIGAVDDRRHIAGKLAGD